MTSFRSTARLWSLRSTSAGNRVSHDLSSRMRALASRIGYLGAGPRDVVELHTYMLRAKMREAPAERAQTLIEETRVLVLVRELIEMPPNAIRLAVRDHGIGIPPEHRAGIFGRFYQVHAGSHLSGLGIGLHVSRQIAELHGGTIEVECPEDGGTRFVVTLPRKARPAVCIEQWVRTAGR